MIEKYQKMDPEKMMPLSDEALAQVTGGFTKGSMVTRWNVQKGNFYYLYCPQSGEWQVALAESNNYEEYHRVLFVKYSYTKVDILWVDGPQAGQHVKGFGLSGTNTRDLYLAN